MDLFDYARQKNSRKEAPLAGRMRPKTLDEVVGQEHIIGKDKLLYRAIQADKLSSIIFYGPPGTGKTTLARVIAQTTQANFVQMNATTSGKKEMQEVQQSPAGFFASFCGGRDDHFDRRHYGKSVFRGESGADFKVQCL